MINVMRIIYDKMNLLSKKKLFLPAAPYGNMLRGNNM